MSGGSIDRKSESIQRKLRLEAKRQERQQRKRQRTAKRKKTKTKKKKRKTGQGTSPVADGPPSMLEADPAGVTLDFAPASPLPTTPADSSPTATSPRTETSPLASHLPTSPVARSVRDTKEIVSSLG